MIFFLPNDVELNIHRNSTLSGYAFAKNDKQINFKVLI